MDDVGELGASDVGAAAAGAAAGVGARTPIAREAVIVFLLLAFAYGYFPKDPEANGNSRLDLVYALVDEGRLTIDSFHARPETFTGDKAFRDGHYYSDKPPGSAFVGAAVYLPIRRLADALGWSPDRATLRSLLTFLAIGLPSAGAGALLFVLCRGIGADRRAAFAATTAIFLGTMTFPYSTMYYGHALAGALVLAAFAVVFRGRAAGARLDTWRTGALFGVLLGMAAITEPLTVALAPALGAYLVHALGRQTRPVAWRRTVSAAIGAAAVPCVLMLAYDAACFGSPTANGYAFHSNPYFRAAMARGVMGIGWPSPRVLFYLTLHPATGILWHSPVLLLGIAGLVVAGRTGRRAEALVIGYAVAVLLLLVSGYYMWWGGHAFGPRHLIPILPLLGLPLAFVPRRMLPLTVALAALSIGQMLIVTAANPQVPDDRIPELRQMRFFDYSPIYSRCLADLRAGRWAPNLGESTLGLHGAASLTPLLAAIAAATAWAATAAGPRSRSAARRHARTRSRRGDRSGERPQPDS